jgi:hypothetical protein
MKLASHPLVAIAASVLACTASAAGHGAQLVDDGSRANVPLHGGAQGVWLAPALSEGHVVARLFDTQGIERFTLDGTLIPYDFFVAAPAQGELLGVLIVPHAPAGRADKVDVEELYARVEGQWIETGGGRGAFSASIFPLTADPDATVLPIGAMQGTFQLIAAAKTRLLGASTARSAVSDRVSSSSANATGAHGSPVPPIEILLPGSRPMVAHALPLGGDGGASGMTVNLANELVDLARAKLAGVAPDASTTPIGLRGRLALRWQLFE